MFDPLVSVFHISFYFVLLTFIPVIILLRVLTLIKVKPKFTTSLLIFFVPFSVAYFYYIPKNIKIRKVYRNIIIAYAVLAFLAFAFAIHVFF
ncbi:MAG TPA: hypothetical protein VFD05_03555 [Bacilli bacterium]|nr:hypothetical protein [Bacilli bacterium]